MERFIESAPIAIQCLSSVLRVEHLGISTFFRVHRGSSRRYDPPRRIESPRRHSQFSLLGIIAMLSISYGSLLFTPIMMILKSRLVKRPLGFFIRPTSLDVEKVESWFSSTYQHLCGGEFSCSSSHLPVDWPAVGSKALTSIFDELDLHLAKDVTETPLSAACQSLISQSQPRRL